MPMNWQKGSEISMKGLELSRRYYEEYGKAMIHDSFPQLEDSLAVGLFGRGSECFGYDDDISRDHDFEPGFCIFVPGEDKVDEKTMFLLERAYSKLPREFAGYSRPVTGPVGGNRHGVFRATDFFLDLTGSSDGVLSDQEWLEIADRTLREATNGEVFRDDSGLVKTVRERLVSMPRDILLKRLAGSLITAAQAGQYNYPRCLKRGEFGAAMMALSRFCEAAMRSIFILNRRYMPYYKWSLKALRDLPKLSFTGELFEFLLTGENSPEGTAKKMETVETLCRLICEELREQDMTKRNDDDLEKQAYAVNERIADNTIRNLDIFAGAE